MQLDATHTTTLTMKSSWPHHDLTRILSHCRIENKRPQTISLKFEDAPYRCPIADCPPYDFASPTKVREHLCANRRVHEFYKCTPCEKGIYPGDACYQHFVQHNTKTLPEDKSDDDSLADDDNKEGSAHDASSDASSAVSDMETAP